MPTIRSKQESLNLGLATYFTGLPCRKGHVAERSCRKGECLTCKSIYSKTWDKANPEKVQHRRKKYREKSDAFIKQRSKEYYSKNKLDFVRRARERELLILQRTPAWANKDSINFFYKYCPKGYHVDHIIPLQGKNVCGLHIETNLQWLPAKENLSKGNKF